MVQEFNSNFINLTAVNVGQDLSVDNQPVLTVDDRVGQHGRYWINSTDGQINYFNGVDYITRWNSSFFPDNDYIDRGNLPDTNPYNIRIRKTGLYLFEARYTSYDLQDYTSTGDSLRFRLRGQIGNPINSTNAGALLHTFQDGFINNTYNGGAYKQGTYLLRVTSNMLPYFIVTVHYALGGSATGGTSTYPVFDNNNGLEPYINVVRIGGLSPVILPV